MKRKNYDQERTRDKLLQTIAQNTKGVQCIGPDGNWRTGKKVSGCVNLSFDEFKMLVHFRKGQVSSFITDLVKTLLNLKKEPAYSFEKKHQIHFLYDVQENAEIQGKMLVGNKPFNVDPVPGSVEASPEKKDDGNVIDR